MFWRRASRASSGREGGGWRGHRQAAMAEDGAGVDRLDGAGSRMAVTVQPPRDGDGECP